MAGIKVTLLRTSVVMPGSGSPVERLFENADGWDFDSGNNLNTLVVVKGASVLYEIPMDHVESVEYI